MKTIELMLTSGFEYESLHHNLEFIHAYLYPYICTYPSLSKSKYDIKVL